MIKSFDDLLESSRPNPPDTAEFRRLNLVRFRAGTTAASTDGGRRRRVLLTTGILTLMMLAGGLFDEPGTYDLTFEKYEFETTRGTGIVHIPTVGSQKITSDKDSEESEIRQIAASTLSGLGRVDGISCLRIGGDELWRKQVSHLVDGEWDSLSEGVKSLASATYDERFREFHRFHFADLMAEIRRRPPDETSRIQADGMTFSLETWHVDYPGFGTVSYSKGRPLT